MSSANEVEIKFLVHEPAELRHTLMEKGFREITPSTYEMNTLYDTPNQDLRKHGELLRIRKYGDNWILTHKSKGGSGRHKSRVELETRIEDGEQLDAILRSLGYAPVFRYEKFRAEWADDTGHVVLDKTPIGDIAEIEGPPDWIDRTAAELGVREKDYITANYAALFQDWKKRSGSAARDMTFEAVGNQDSPQES